MKKMLCVLLVAVLMVGVFVLPASAEDAAGKLFKLNLRFADYVGMDYQYIVCGKNVSVDGETVIKYGALDHSGNVVVPFEYDYATDPDSDQFLVGKTDPQTGAIKEYIIGRDYNRPTDVSDLFRVQGVYCGSIGFHAGIRQLSYIEVDPDTGAVKIIRKSTNTTETVFEHQCSDKVSMIAYCVTDIQHYAYTDGLTMILTDGTNTKEFTADGDDQVIVPMGFDDGYLYYGRTTVDYETLEVTDTTVWRTKLEDSINENLTEVYGAVDFSVASLSSVVVGGKTMFVNNEGMTAYVDLVNNVNTGYIFDYAVPSFGDGYFPAIVDGKATYYTEDGNPTEKYYADCTGFYFGEAVVTDLEGDTYVINTDFERVSENSINIGDATLVSFVQDRLLIYDSGYQMYLFTDDPNYSLFGDVSQDGLVDVADIMLLKNYIMNDDKSEAVLAVADLDASGAADVADIMLLKNIIMTS